MTGSSGRSGKGRKPRGRPAATAAPAPLESLLAEVLKFEWPADGILRRFFAAHREMGPRDRSRVAETVFDVLRNRRLYAHLAQAGSGPMPARLIALSDGRDRIDTDGLAPGGAAEPAGLAVRAAERALPSEEVESLGRALLEPAPLDLRVNPMKSDRDAVVDSLRADRIDCAPLPLGPLAIRVRASRRSRSTAAFATGLVEVQDCGSQLIAHLVRAAPRPDGGRLLRRRRRQDPGAGGAAARHRAGVRLRRVGDTSAAAAPAPGALRGEQRPALRDRQRTRPQARPAGRASRCRAGRRALQRHRNPAPQSGPEVADERRGDRRAGREAARHPGRGRPAGAPGRRAGVRDLQPARRGERRRAALRSRRRTPAGAATRPPRCWRVRGRRSRRRSTATACGCVPTVTVPTRSTRCAGFARTERRERDDSVAGATRAGRLAGR